MKFIVSEAKGVLDVTTGSVRISFRKQNGGVISIQNIATNKTPASVGELPGEERLFRILGFRQSHPYLMRDSNTLENAVWDIKEDVIKITYPEFCFEDGSGVSAAVTLRPSPLAGRDEIIFTLDVSNSGAAFIHEIQFPMLPGFTSPAEATAGARWRRAVGEVSKAGWPTYVNYHNKFHVNYPDCGCCAPWFDITGEQGGLSLVNYMREPLTGGVGIINFKEYDKGVLECYYWRHYPLVREGGAWSSEPVGVGVHDGDWHTTADNYLGWFKTEIGVTIDPPRGLRESIGFQNIFIRSFDGAPVNGIEDMPRFAAEGARLGVGHISLWDNPTLGNYVMFDMDADLCDYPDDEKTRLGAAIRQMRNDGTHVSALVNFRHVNITSGLYGKYKDHAIKRIDGTDLTENYLTIKHTATGYARHFGGVCIPLSPHSEKTAERVHSVMDKYEALGYDSLFFDQPFHYELDYNLQKPGDRPDNGCGQWFALIEDVNKRLKARDKDAYIIGEMLDIFSAARAIDFHMEWNYINGNSIDLLARVHYAFPPALMSCVIDYTMAGEAEASHAFAAGLYLCICIDGNTAGIGKRKELAEHVLKLANLRKRCLERTVYATFRETRGVTLETDSRAVRAYAYDSEKGPAVIISAGNGGGKGKVKIDLGKFHAPCGKGAIYHLDGSRGETECVDTLEFTMPANHVIVWYV